MSIGETAMNSVTTAMMMQTSPAVQLWMGWMVFIFLCAIFFTRNHPQANRTLLAVIATVAGAYIIWTMTLNIHLFGLVHIFVWGPLAIYLWNSVLSKTARRHDGDPNIGQYYTVKYKMFFYWVCLLFATIIISLVFDIRDILLVMTGTK